MSELTSPATAAIGETTASVTLPTGERAKQTPVRLVHSLSEIFDFFVDILDEDSIDRDTLKGGIESLIRVHWQVHKWGD